ncbi:hypothetical protein CMV_004324 [Castanea mollissima]|uniref:Uncharacterized protein n=1 Tax=Castanea mollissima TaxID=60419 RepID=A0A8J4RFQ3_9ROSI|nr:hypothetical protein CMV_004324 [Castanea mollissima]
MVARWVTIPDNGGRPLLDHDKSWVAVARSQLGGTCRRGLRPSTRAITKSKCALEKELEEVNKALVERTAKLTTKTQVTNDKLQAAYYQGQKDCISFNIPYPKNLIKVANLEILEIKDDTSSVREMENPTVDAAVRAMDPATKGKA